MGELHFVFAVHNHQPLGNFEHVFAAAADEAYIPFLETMQRYPWFRFGLHTSGCLLDWLERNRPRYVELVARMVADGQIEPISGGYYEPLLPVIPEEDAVGQLDMMNRFIRTRLGAEPTGFWLTERVWEPYVPRIASRAGLRYTCVDDTHFLYAGLRTEELRGYFVTEHDCHTLAVFPIDHELRYLIPFKEPERTVEYLASLREAGVRMVCMADDGEKFGVWPGTREWVYERGWLERFLATLEANLSWLRITGPGEYLRTHPPAGRVYLPVASYEEMSEWALPPDASARLEELFEAFRREGTYDEMRRFMRGGFWRNFMAKYPESNNMHKKMYLVSAKARASGNEEAVHAVMRGQCNCPYWHGVFGGLYLNYLRAETYRNLIEAEVLAERESGAFARAQVCDFDCDGRDEVLVETDLLNLYLKPSEGGFAFELDSRPAGVNILDTLARRKEAYHAKMLRQSRGEVPQTEGPASIHHLAGRVGFDIADLLHYDWYRRGSYIDHFPAEGTTLQDFARARYRELGDFVLGEYSAEVETPGDSVAVGLRRDGALWMDGGPVPLRLEKRIILKAGSGLILAEYTVTNTGEAPLAALFGVEFNAALLAPDAPDRYYLIDGERPSDPRPASTGESAGVRSVCLVDEWRRFSVELRLGKPARVWRFPVETLSQSEGGADRIYQSSVVVPLWELALGPKASESIVIEQEIRTWL